MKTYPLYNNQSSDISKNYYKMIFHSCDSKVLNKSGKKSKYLDEYYPVEVFPFGSDDGDNPVFLMVKNVGGDLNLVAMVQ